MEISPLQRKVKATEVPLDRLIGSKSVSTHDKLDAASRAFESVLLRQILESAQKTVIPSSFTSETTSSSVYRDLITTQLADGISRSGQFGLARTFMQQWDARAASSAAASLAPPGTPSSPGPKASASTLSPAESNDTPTFPTASPGGPSPRPADRTGTAGTFAPLRGAARLKPLFHGPELKAFRHE